ncbi:MerR family transcriptional regulator [Glaciimonas soli]|uniref:MerR family transcriptional regulator n=1 Tax=Glaciimonas soli TaxID=2590999 RepID=A0A843YL37_9BURK|nr:MerR family transcriptional regulator [Glaciimonas soli]MQQ99649.1 MerR family transcriptional regulator [Glaciimonas soli]
MTDRISKSELIVLPPIPTKRYFTIGEVSDLCGVKPHVLRYWEQEFTQLKPVKRRGNRRYYQHHEVLLIRHIRELLYEQGFTISGARNKLDDRLGQAEKDSIAASQEAAQNKINLIEVHHELEQILELLTVPSVPEVRP